MIIKTLKSHFQEVFMHFKKHISCSENLEYRFILFSVFCRIHNHIDTRWQNFPGPDTS